MANQFAHQPGQLVAQCTKNRVLSSLAVLLFFVANVGAQSPMRPLPQGVKRPHDEGPARFVDPQQGDDAAAGTSASPWRTLKHAVKQLKPGDTLYLRGGVYHENVTGTLQGTEQAPITIRAVSGELVILDGGLAEFLNAPSTSWEPLPEGAPGEYRSTKTYAGLNLRGEGVHVMGHFAATMIPLHGYNVLGDLRSDNIYWNLDRKVAGEQFIYCGPGIFYDPASQRIHARLAHTKMPYFPASQNYAGETDPRKVPLVIGAVSRGATLALHDCRYLRVFDIAVRGSAGSTIDIDRGHQIILDGVTAYGGGRAIRVADTSGLRVVNSAFRGIAAPWTFRGSLKYRALEARVFAASGWSPTWPGNRDFELAYSEFTDCVDGVFIGSVARCQFHHNLVENISDDAIFLTAGTAFDGTTPGGGHVIRENRIAQCLTCFAFGVGHGRQKVLENSIQTGAMTYITRNVFDLRAPVPYGQPRGADAPQEIVTRGRVCGDHGSPAWEPMAFYHNTVLEGESPFRAGYGSGMGVHISRGVPRRVINNLFVGTRQAPGNVFPEIAPAKDGKEPVVHNLQADGNCHGCLAADFDAEAFTKQLKRTSQNADMRAGKNLGWGAHDQVANPKLVAMTADHKLPSDARLEKDSPARNAGVVVDANWPDPLRKTGTEVRDVGALPFGVEPWGVGTFARLDVNGAARQPSSPESPRQLAFLPNVAPPPQTKNERAVIVSGYPAPDVPLLEYALQRSGYQVEVLEKTWLDTARYEDYQFVALVGDIARAKIVPAQYSADDIEQVTKFLTKGGTLFLLQKGKDVFRTSEGMLWLDQQIGWEKNGTLGTMRIHQPNEASTKHLTNLSEHWWESTPNAKEFALRANRGEVLLADERRHSILYRQSIGKGRWIYLGFSPAVSLPATRDRASNVGMEAVFESQMTLLMKLMTTEK